MAGRFDVQKIIPDNAIKHGAAIVRGTKAGATFLTVDDYVVSGPAIGNIEQKFETKFLEAQLKIIPSEITNNIAIGNTSLTNLTDNMLIKYLKITTTSTDWTLTSYSKNDYITGPRTLAASLNGNATLYIDSPYKDESLLSQFHYTFTSASGSELHDIEFRGFELT